MTHVIDLNLSLLCVELAITESKRHRILSVYTQYQ